MRMRATASKVAFNPRSQVIGRISTVASCRQVIYRQLDEQVDTVGKAGKMLPRSSLPLGFGLRRRA